MHVVANVAMSADGKLSSRRREQVMISGPADFTRVDVLRSTCDAVLVGVGTVLADDPHLTVDDPDLRTERRERGKTAHPARVVTDSHARTPPESRILDDAATTYLLVCEDAPEERLSRLRDTDARIVTAGDERANLGRAFATLTESGIDRLLIEGGGEVLFSAFEADLIDELSVFVGPVVIGGRDAPTLADGEGFVEKFPKLELESVERLDDGVLLEYAVE